jgi:ABC-type nitrate/sulfonate/bicarbonate transport system substrate-binding protein
MAKLIILLSIYLLGNSFIEAPPPPNEITCFIASHQQIQFAGLIVAMEKSIYSKYGVKVKFVYGDRNKASSMLTTGAADIVTLMLPTAVQLRSNGLKIVNAGQIIQRSSLVCVTKKAHGIKSLQDLKQKKSEYLAATSGSFLMRFSKNCHPISVPLCRDHQ